MSDAQYRSCLATEASVARASVQALKTSWSWWYFCSDCLCSNL